MSFKSERTPIILYIIFTILTIICFIGVIVDFSPFWLWMAFLLSVISMGTVMFNFSTLRLSRQSSESKFQPKSIRPVVIEFNPEEEPKPWSEYTVDLDAINSDHSDIPSYRSLDKQEGKDEEKKATTRHTFNTWSGEVDSPTPRLRGNWPTWGIGTEYDKAVVINDATYVVNTHTGIGIEVVPDTYEPVVSEVMDENGTRYYSYTGIQIIK